MSMEPEEEERWDTNYGWAPPHRGLYNRTPPPNTTTPRVETLTNFGSLGMMGDNDGQAPPRRYATNMSLPPSMPSLLGGNP